MTIDIKIDFMACGGEEQQFADWLNEHDEIDADVNDASETTIDGERDHNLGNDLWEAYCSDNKPLRDRLVAEYIAEKNAAEDDDSE